ncbi:Spy/CpxP family protein refolding chaperone [Tardiphaga sp. vice154]|uniref:Spy/CpxP family protein refolding chaperone n=1 Tax=Tardiphaga sp. vice154 TaxID=2592814 RepID=UPI00143D0C25|nr:Spy/CpxP family protein refolding chaperone [Tardiphaga sp. vice154]
MTLLRGMMFAALLLAAGGGAASAQPFNGPPMMMDRGFWPGHGPENAPGFGRMCRSGSRAFTVASASRVAQDLRLDDTQRAAYEAYAASAAKAAETMRAACPSSPSRSVPARMEAMESRAGAMITAIAMVRPSLDTFYAGLTEAQKARFDSGSGRRHFWHMREAW